MRSLIKKLVTVMVAAFVVSMFSMIVSANTLISSGHVTANYCSYSWEYYSDDLLKLYPEGWLINIDENDLPSINLSSNTTIYIDVSNIHIDPVYRSALSIHGANCPSYNLIIGGDGISDGFYNISIHDFDSLESVYFDDDAYIDWVGIYDCGLNNINIFDQLYTDVIQVTNCSNLVNVNVPSNLERFELVDCVNVESIAVPDDLEALYVENSPKLVDYEIPETLKSCELCYVGISQINVPVSCERFSIMSDSLEEASIESGRKQIDLNMFHFCSNLTDVYIPDSVTRIEYNAFTNCTNLRSIDLPGSVTSIGRGAFRNTGLESFNIPNGVTTIEYATFRGCSNLSEVLIPASVTQIDESSFQQCSNLTDVCFMGSRALWYNIKVYNGWDERVSDKTIDEIFGDADIWIDDLDLFKTQPEDFTGPVGYGAFFNVETYGEIASYQWQYLMNDTWINFMVPSAKTAQLEIPITEERNGLKVRCVVTDTTGLTCTSEEATLNVCKSITILEEPEDVICAPGETAVFSVVADGEDLTYQWQVNKVTYWANCSVKDGAKTDTLALEAKESRDGCVYMCVITDKYGYSVATKQVVLTVGNPLEIKTQPEDCSGYAGDTAVFTVNAAGSGLKYQWQTLKSGTWTNCSINDGAKTATLSLAIKDSRNGSKYHCIVTDKYGETATTNEVTLSVLSPLSIKTQPADFAGHAGETAEFTVVAEGEGLKYQWQVYKNGTWTNCSINDGAKTAALSLEIKASRDGLKYHCIVTDKSGATVTTRDATLSILKILAIVSEPGEYIFANVGDSVDFVVEAQGEGLKYQWQVFKNGTWINCSINDGAKTNKLTLEAKTSRSQLQYHCVVTDKYGNTLTTEPTELYVIDLWVVAASAEADSSPAESNADADYVEIVEIQEVTDAEDTADTSEDSVIIEITEVIETVPEADAEAVTAVD